MKSKNTPTSANYNYYLKLNTSKYKDGEWIAIAKNKVVAHGEAADKVYKDAVKKAQTDDVALAKIPQAGLMILTVV